ncbi:hypothetical protein RHGRI_034957 [Rhododendron griersonianum]|uniref:Uncharacterized protein n=1 Tax=Rhododendron griersonianum TaxID=479676 RepID=A0AAV6I2S3_9ERIC|nr:hypothetical protein RHGRI_034957 [Rhododendron griersonianum]
MEKEEDNYTKDGTVDYRGTECCERLAYYGMSSNLVLYFKHRLNQQSGTASKNQSHWAGTCYITPLIGAFLADSYLGRYWTIACFSTIYIYLLPGLRPACVTKEDCHPIHSQSAVTFLALYLIALGTGGIKPCVSSYGADQFDDADEAEKNHKSSFFNWFYFSINIGALIASSVLVWKPGGSPLTRICQVIVASVRKCHVKVPEDKSLLYETADAESAIKGSRKLDHTKDLSFFDKAAVEVESNNKKSSKDPWSLCTVTQVEELKAIVRLLPIWATGIIFAAVYNQMGNFFVLQGVFTLIGQSEFFYDQAPDAMRSLSSALSLTTVALGNYLSSLLIAIVTSISTKNGKLGWIPDNLNYGHLDYFFWLLAIMSVLNLGVYFFIAKWYTYKRQMGTLR